MTLVLGIETSCDDTAAAVIRRSPNGECEILSNIVWTDFAEHRAYGGVVPEIAARSHVERIDQVIAQAVDSSGHIYAELDLVAATAGPGLLGGVLVGLTAGKAVAMAHNLRLAPVNHLEGHALSVRMTEKVDFPYLLLLISGGHTQLVLVENVGLYRRLGTTIDDAAGEAFDKTAKLLGLGQPGGPRIESAATGGRAGRFRLPSPLSRHQGADFSFSGLKTALRLAAESIEAPKGQDIADLAASFQAAAASHLANRTDRAMETLAKTTPSCRTLVAAGGVASNCTVKAALSSLAVSRGWRLVTPPPKFCTDNAAMIAWAGAERRAAGLLGPEEETLAFAPRARWPLAPPPPGREHGGGKRGPKA